MKRTFFFVLVLLVAGCGQQKDSETLPGTFRYLSYQWNNTADNAGLSLNHYMEITKDGNYKLILRLPSDSTGYYYGFLNPATLSKLKNFVADTSWKNAYLDSATGSGKPRFRFDYSNAVGRKKITFASEGSPAAITSLQATLDSVIRAPGKKQNPTFNINSYLRNIITEDSAMH